MHALSGDYDTPTHGQSRPEDDLRWLGDAERFDRDDLERHEVYPKRRPG